MAWLWSQKDLECNLISNISWFVILDKSFYVSEPNYDTSPKGCCISCDNVQSALHSGAQPVVPSRASLGNLLEM